MTSALCPRWLVMERWRGRQRKRDGCGWSHSHARWGAMKSKHRLLFKSDLNSHNPPQQRRSSQRNYAEAHVCCCSLRCSLLNKDHSQSSLVIWSDDFRMGKVGKQNYIFVKNGLCCQCSEMLSHTRELNCSCFVSYQATAILQYF